MVYGHCFAHNPTVVNRSRTVPMLFQLLQWSMAYMTLSFIGKAFPLLLTHFRCGTCKNNEVLLTTWFCYWMWDYSLIFFSSSHKPNNKSLHYISRFRMLMALCNSWEALYEWEYYQRTLFCNSLTTSMSRSTHPLSFLKCQRLHQIFIWFLSLLLYNIIFFSNILLLLLVICLRFSFLQKMNNWL